VEVAVIEVLIALAVLAPLWGYPFFALIADILHVNRDAHRAFVIDGVLDRKTTEQIARQVGRSAAMRGRL
jgi:hypothetical protein